MSKKTQQFKGALKPKGKWAIRFFDIYGRIGSEREIAQFMKNINYDLDKRGGFPQSSKLKK